MPGVSCAADTFDHDSDPSTACQARSLCEAGQYVEDDGSATSDRVCASCSPGTFSNVSNAGACIPWTVCNWGEFETEAPSATADRSCEGASTTAGVVVLKYDPNGNEMWTQFEDEDPDAVHSARAMAVDSRGRVFVAGVIYGSASSAGFIWLVPEP